MTAGPANDSWVASVHRTAGDKEPLGAAVIIDTRRALTAAHVVLHRGAVAEELWVAFPKAHPPVYQRCRVESLVLAEHVEDVDLALLVLAGDVPAGVWPARLLCPSATRLVNRRWWAFGFPDRQQWGDSAGGKVDETLGYGSIRLATESASPLASGFSGGGLWSPDYEAVVAVVSDSRAVSGGGRAITLFEADRCFPGQRLRRLADSWSTEQAGQLALASWGWTLRTDPEGRRHWRPRARGVSVDTERGHRFRGRAAALKAITAWLDRDEPDQRVLVVTGSPGVGKSAVLGRVVTSADPGIRAALPADDEAWKATPGSVACAVHAKGKTALDVATEIARAASAALPDTLADFEPDLRAALTERPGTPRARFNVVIDALDEATSPAEARGIVARVVLPLVNGCAGLGAQVVLATRRGDDEGELIPLFGSAAHVVNLDSPEFYAERDVVEYAKATLQLLGDPRPGNPYADGAVAGPVAAAIARRSAHSFLIAGLIARTHALHDAEPVDPAALTFPPEVKHALDAYTSRLPGIGGLPAAAALTALAFAEAPGFDVELWALAIRTLAGAEVTAGELLAFAHSSAANFLVESDDRHEVFRLFHQALDDTLLGERSDLRTDHRALTRAFMGFVEPVPPYLARSLAGHAARGGVLKELLCRTPFVLHADLARVIVAASVDSSPAVRACLRLIRLTPMAAAAGPAERAAMFDLTAVVADLPRMRALASRDAPYRAEWAEVRPRFDEAVLLGHGGRVTAVTSFVMAGRTLLASSGVDGTIRLWDPATGLPVHAPIRTPVGSMLAMSAVTLKGRVLLAAIDFRHDFRLWDPATGQPVDCALTRVQEGGEYLCTLPQGDDDLVAVAGHSGDLTVWDLVTGQPVGSSSHLREDIRGLSYLARHDWLVTATYDSRIDIWDAGTKRLLHTLDGVHQANAICAFSLDDPVLLAVGDLSGRLHLRDGHLSGHTDLITDICVFTLEDRTLLATASADGSIRLWDPLQRELPLHDPVHGSCALLLHERVLLADIGDPGKVRLRDPAGGRTARFAAGHPLSLQTFAHALLIITEPLGFRVWDPATGEPATALIPLTPQAVEPIDARSLAVVADEIGQVVDRETGKRRLLRPSRFARPLGDVAALCVCTVNGKPLIATAHHHGEVRLWDATTGRPAGRPLLGHGAGARDVCAFVLKRQVLLASASWDRTVRMWDPATSRAFGSVLTGHSDVVSAVCALTLGGRVLLASGSADATVRVWDPAAGTCLLTVPVHDAVRKCAWLGGLLIVYGKGGGILAIRPSELLHAPPRPDHLIS
ncbi:hypothetical protein FXF51_13025 [Nonomuraea sp. PA05]|uniref:AAA family ATPase n=1 Tax=Nonomuraea sp. PA05 TaxID=2604466 RepID=UPI0011D730B6|nr:trypsin-like peptidase domain-containing protein [Nonomuraea sp. PA05]TYB67701.1 hypothetical protein FXF51_13025 [Nonomuraea sp. PA05]